MNSAPIRADGASGKPRCRPSWTPPAWRAKNRTWHALRDRRHQQSRSGGHPPRQIEQLSGQVATSTYHERLRHDAIGSQTSERLAGAALLPLSGGTGQTADIALAV